MKIEDFHAEIVINEVKLRPRIFDLNFLSLQIMTQTKRLENFLKFKSVRSEKKSSNQVL